MKQNYQMMITRVPKAWAWFYRNSGGLKFDSKPDITAGLRNAIGELHSEAPAARDDLHLPDLLKAAEPARDHGHRAAASLHWSSRTPSAFIPCGSLRRATATAWRMMPPWTARLKLGAEPSAGACDRLPVSLRFHDAPRSRRSASPRTAACSNLLLHRSQPCGENAGVPAPVFVSAGVRLTPARGQASPRACITWCATLTDSCRTRTLKCWAGSNQTSQAAADARLRDLQGGQARFSTSHSPATCPAIIDYVVPGQEEGMPSCSRAMAAA